MNNTSKFVFFHLYNDFSGSPMVLTPVINGFIDKGMDVELVTSKGFFLQINTNDVYTKNFTTLCSVSPFISQISRNVKSSAHSYLLEAISKQRSKKTFTLPFRELLFNVINSNTGCLLSI